MQLQEKTVLSSRLTDLSFRPQPLAGCGAVVRIGVHVGVPGAVVRAASHRRRGGSGAFLVALWTGAVHNTGRDRIHHTEGDYPGESAPRDEPTVGDASRRYRHQQNRMDPALIH